MKTMPPITNQMRMPRRSETGPAKDNPTGVMLPLRLISIVKTRPCISAGTTDCNDAKNTPFAIAFMTEKRNTHTTASRNRCDGITLKIRMKPPPIITAAIAVTIRFLKPPQAPRISPPAIIPTPLAD